MLKMILPCLQVCQPLSMFVIIDVSWQISMLAAGLLAWCNHSPPSPASSPTLPPQLQSNSVGNTVLLQLLIFFWAGYSTQVAILSCCEWEGLETCAFDSLLYDWLLVEIKSIENELSININLIKKSNLWSLSL